MIDSLYQYDEKKEIVLQNIFYLKLGSGLWWTMLTINLDLQRPSEKIQPLHLDLQTQSPRTHD